MTKIRFKKYAHSKDYSSPYICVKGERKETENPLGLRIYETEILGQKKG